jgi:2-hydroxychromene-2-carboxylate isomerase
MRGKKMNFKPKHFPTNPALADHTICAIVADGGDPFDYMGSVFAAVWAHERDVADEAVISELLSQSGFDAQAVIEKAKSSEIAAIRVKNTEDAIAADATGVPSFVLNGEPFWGQDRLDVLDHALTTGRGPYKAL